MHRLNLRKFVPFLKQPSIYPEERYVEKIQISMNSKSIYYSFVINMDKT